MPIMPVTREAPWNCQSCGHEADATTPDFDQPDRAPVEDDVAVCIYCGMPHIRHGTAWLLPTAAEIATFEPATVAKLNDMATRARRARP